MNRLAARLGSGLADTAANLSLLAQDAPARLQQEFSLFWEEVEQEAARLERDGSEGPWAVRRRPPAAACGAASAVQQRRPAPIPRTRSMPCGPR